MEHKFVDVAGIKTSGDDLAEGEFVGFGAYFNNVDSDGDRIRKGAFASSLKSGAVVPLVWQHLSSDPRNLVGEVIEAAETEEGLRIKGRLDLDTEHGRAAHKAVKGRRITGLSIGFGIRRAVKAADGARELIDLDLAEISLVTRPANDRALIGSVKSADRREHLRERVARAQLQAKGAPAMGFYEPTDLNDPFERALIKATTPSPEKLRAAGGRWTKERDDNLTKAREITELARELDRDLTGDEATQVQKHLDAAEQATKAIAAAQRSQQILAKLDAMAAGSAPLDGSSSSRAGDDNRRLSFKGMAAAAAKNMLGSDGLGTKALAPSGATVVGQEFVADPIPLGRVATGLLDVLPVKVHGSPEYAYTRQGITGRTNNAAVVAAGAVKPTSVLGIERVEQTLAVIAHLSEGVSRYWLIDNESLQAFVDNELRFGLGVAVEAKVVDDINATSGIQTQAYVSSVLATIRKGITKLEVTGYTAGAILLHPSDWESVELALSSTNAVEHMSLPYDPATRRLFGVPIVTTVSEDAGVSHVLAAGAVVLDTDSRGIDVQWSETSNTDDWSRNLIRARCEGRFGTSVLSPLGVVTCDLTA